MAVTTTSSSVSYTGNGSTTVFTVPFKFMASSDLAVVVTLTGGSPIVKTLGVDYSVSGAGVDAGGSVTMTAAPASGATVAISRATALTQTTSFQTQGSFPPKVHEAAFDKLTLEAQEVAARAAALEASMATANAAIQVLQAGGGGGGGGASTKLFLLEHTTPEATAGDSVSVVGRSHNGLFQVSEKGGSFHSPSDLATYYPRDYGTLAWDGSTDDSAVVQLALTAAGNAGGGTVELPPGTGAVKNLSVPANVIVQGKGRLATTLKVLAGVGVIGVTLGDRARLRNVRVIGPGGAQVVTDNLGTADGVQTTFTGTLSSLPAVPGYLGINNQGVSIGTSTDAGDDTGVISGAGIASGTVNYRTGAISVTLSAAPVAGHRIDANYWYQMSLVQMGGDFASTGFNGNIVVEDVEVSDSFNANVGIRLRSCLVGFIDRCKINGTYFGIKLEQNPANGAQLANAIFAHKCHLTNNAYGAKSAGGLTLVACVTEGNSIALADDVQDTGNVFTNFVAIGCGFENGVANAKLPFGGAINLLATSHPSALHLVVGGSLNGTQAAGDIITTSPTVDVVNAKLQHGATASSAGLVKIVAPRYASPDAHTYAASGTGKVRVDNADGSREAYIGSSSNVAGAWQDPNRFGATYLWVDASTRLRIKATAPTSDTDGTVVGTQS